MKIGFIDYYLDEWHSNNYPELIAKASNGAHEVCCAFAYREPPAEMNLRSNAQWSADYGIPLVSSIEEVIERSDCLVVLSPDNPEMHEILCQLPLASGKRTYIDKTFAPDKATAERIFAIIPPASLLPRCVLPPSWMRSTPPRSTRSTPKAPAAFLSTPSIRSSLSFV